MESSRVHGYTMWMCMQWILQNTKFNPLPTTVMEFFICFFVFVFPFPVPVLLGYFCVVGVLFFGTGNRAQGLGLPGRRCAAELYPQPMFYLLMLGRLHRNHQGSSSFCTETASWGGLAQFTQWPGGLGSFMPFWNQVILKSVCKIWLIDHLMLM